MEPRPVIVRYTKREVFKEVALFNKIWDNLDMLKYSESDIIDILEGFNRYIGEVVASTREGVALPLHMGILMAGTWGNDDTYTGGKFNPNHHSDQYGGMVYYITQATKARFGIGKYWGFFPDHIMKKHLQKGYKTNWKLYANVPKSNEAWKLYVQYKKREFAKEYNKDARDNYDEFDLDFEFDDID